MLTQSFMEKATQELAIKGMKLALACLLAHCFHSVRKIVRVAIQKTFLLNEIHEHEAIKHKRGKPSLIRLGIYTFNEI